MDKRIFNRVDFKKKAEIFLKTKSSLEGLTIDLSLKGISIMIAEHEIIHMGDDFEIKVFIDENENLDFIGNVRWIKTLPEGHRKIGFYFKKMDSMNFNKLFEILCENGFKKEDIYAELREFFERKIL
jgi:hypothetical protein